MLLRVEAQRVRRPTPPAKRHRHVGSVGGFGDGETGAAAPFRRIYEHSATTMRHQTHHCERSRQRRCGRPPARDKPSDGTGAGAGRTRATVGICRRGRLFSKGSGSAVASQKPVGRKPQGSPLAVLFFAFISPSRNSAMTPEMPVPPNSGDETRAHLRRTNAGSMVSGRRMPSTR